MTGTTSTTAAVATARWGRAASITAVEIAIVASAAVLAQTVLRTVTDPFGACVPGTSPTRATTGILWPWTPSNE